MRIGIIGGGQLARMMVPPAHRLGWEVWVLEKSDNCPAKLAGAKQVVGDWSDPETAREFAREMDVVTLDHEFAPLQALQAVEEVSKLYPSSATMDCIVDKLEQKRCLLEAGLPVAESVALQDLDDLPNLGASLGWPLMVKARFGGYDGKGNVTLKPTEDWAQALAELSGPFYVEEFCRFRSELAVMVVRDQKGNCSSYPVVDTVQENHICKLVRFPSQVDSATAQRARTLAQKAAEAVGLVGVMGVELFLLESGEILLNELAPRPHNSGHYSLDACLTSQFENHIRAVGNLPLGSTEPTVGSAVMVNLLGDGEGSGEVHGLQDVLSNPQARLHLYGKSARVGRKLGHLTLLGAEGEQLDETAQELASRLTFRETVRA